MGNFISVDPFGLHPFSPLINLIGHVGQVFAPKHVALSQAEQARKRHGIDVVNHYNFAVVGVSGVGKSLFINKVRGLTNKDPEWAKVGITETTQHIKGYKHPMWPAIMLWDIPGSSTPDHPELNYFDDKCLYAFDHLIILVRDRIHSIDMMIAKQASERDVPFTFVRTAANQSMESLIYGRKMSQKEAFETLKKQTAQSIADSSKRVSLTKETPLYIIDNLELDSHDGPLLANHIVSHTVSRRTQVTPQWIGHMILR